MEGGVSVTDIAGKRGVAGGGADTGIEGDETLLNGGDEDTTTSQLLLQWRE